MAATLAQRQRSNTSTSTSSSHGPHSRASTTSAQSTTAQPPQQYRYPGPSAQQRSHSQQSYSTQQQQHAPYTPEEMITQNQRQFSNPYGIDPLLYRQENQRRSMSAGPQHSSNVDISGNTLGRRQSFDGPPPFQGINDEQAQEDTGTEAGKKKKGSASSAANDMELRRLFAEHRGRPLKDVAAEVIVHERGPKSEKTKQIFAMLW